MKQTPFHPFTVKTGPGCTVLTREQALTFLTPEEIETGEKRFEIETSGPWHVVSKVAGIAAFTTWKPGPCGEVSDSLTIIGARSLNHAKSEGYSMEGKVSYAGKAYRAFTSSTLFQIDGKLVAVALLHVCGQAPAV